MRPRSIVAGSLLAVTVLAACQVKPLAPGANTYVYEELPSAIG